MTQKWPAWESPPATLRGCPFGVRPDSGQAGIKAFTPLVTAAVRVFK